MRICLLTPTFLPLRGGAERAADTVVRGLAGRGHDVSVLAGGRPRRKDGGPPNLPYPVRRYLRPPAQHLWPEVLALPVWRHHRAWRFEVLLAFYGYPTGYAGSLLKRRLRYGLVVSPRGADLYPNFHALRKPRVRRIIAAGYRRADRIVSISRWITQRLHEVAGPDLPPIDTVPNGIDLRAHDRGLREARSGPVEPPFILHMARLAPVKQPALAIEALAPLRDLFLERGLTYVFAGDGASRAELEAMIRARRLEQVVKFVGWCAGPQKAYLLRNASLLVSTSREEGLPNVVIEAMASGLPVVASDIDPHRELIEGRGWGWLFRSGDPGDLTATLRAALAEDLAPRRRRAMALRESYSLEAMIDGFEQACRATVPS